MFAKNNRIKGISHSPNQDFNEIPSAKIPLSNMNNSISNHAEKAYLELLGISSGKFADNNIGTIKGTINTDMARIEKLQNKVKLKLSVE